MWNRLPCPNDNQLDKSNVHGEKNNKVMELFSRKKWWLGCAQMSMMLFFKNCLFDIVLIFH